jgi:hypothetical protein
MNISFKLYQCSIITSFSFEISLWFRTKYIKYQYTGYTQKNGVVSKVNKDFISHLTRAQHTPSAAAIVQVSHAYCVAAGPVSKMALQQEKAFCVLRFEVSRSVITVREFRARLQKDAPHKNNISRWYRQFVETGCLCKGKSPGRPRV